MVLHAAALGRETAFAHLMMPPLVTILASEASVAGATPADAA